MSIKLQALSYFWPRMSIFSYAGWQVEFHLSTLRNMSYNNDGPWRPFRVIESSDWDNRLLNFMAGVGWQVTAFIPSHLVEKEIKHTLPSGPQAITSRLKIYTYHLFNSSEKKKDWEPWLENNHKFPSRSRVFKETATAFIFCRHTDRRIKQTILNGIWRPLRTFLLFLVNVPFGIPAVHAGITNSLF